MSVKLLLDRTGVKVGQADSLLACMCFTAASSKVSAHHGDAAAGDEARGKLHLNGVQHPWFGVVDVPLQQEPLEVVLVERCTNTEHKQPELQGELLSCCTA